MNGSESKYIGGNDMNMIQESIELFEAIGDTSSRIEKENLLRDGKENDVFKVLLHNTYNPFLVFHIKKDPTVKPKVSFTAEFPTGNYQLFISILEKLHLRKVTGNDAIANVNDFFRGCSPREYKWYLKVLQKDLKIGITDKTINKVFPNLIPTFDCMLAHPIKEFPRLFTIDRKLDGYRCLATHDSRGNVLLQTRNGNLIEGYDGIEADIKLLPKGYIYDGEIMAGGDFRGVQKSAFKKSKDKQGVLHIFDCIPVDEFKRGKSSKDLLDRLEFLDNLDSVIESANCLNRVEYMGTFNNTPADIERVYAYHSRFKSEGYEGTMVKRLDAKYECKRTYSIQKIKDMDTLDLTIVGVEEGKAGTKYEGMLGALVVEYEGNTVNVGSGYTDAQRVSFWADKNNLINRTIEVQFQEKTTNEDGKPSLRFPVFIRVRDDK